jgi:hypothetical protein
LEKNNSNKQKAPPPFLYPLKPGQNKKKVFLVEILPRTPSGEHLQT